MGKKESKKRDSNLSPKHIIEETLVSSHELEKAKKKQKKSK